MAGGIDDHSRPAGHRSPIDASYRGGSLLRGCASADGVGPTCNPWRSNIDIVTAGREIGARVTPDRDIEIAGAVVLEGGNAIRCVVVAGCIGSKGKETVSGILLPVLFLKSALTP